ncbi:hypothetical protein X802_09460 [Thermococcus guaymasensis DSM 11113]|uniref:DUF3783 domain-containing protein n=1 Tax=Thermococcus guaymasensis DSM 11113 TaxID=1432656 RepID=A0A0X1KM56_9EURY|nr:DUF3783 domain-containing protein [Thermococcus guaymasensis]AJC72347.1 hypothetical protein X802_09460 [Thermococcus guaymasensis DSM 11113]
MAKVLAIGFNREELGLLRKALEGIPVEGVSTDYLGGVVSEIFEKAKGDECDWHERKFVLMAGVDGETIKEIVDRVKALGLGRIIFAAPTEISMKWKLEDLLEELIEEDEYFRALAWARKEAKKKGSFLDFKP